MITALYETCCNNYLEQIDQEIESLITTQNRGQGFFLLSVLR